MVAYSLTSAWVLNLCQSVSNERTKTIFLIPPINFKFSQNNGDSRMLTIYWLLPFAFHLLSSQNSADTAYSANSSGAQDFLHETSYNCIYQDYHPCSNNPPLFSLFSLTPWPAQNILMHLFFSLIMRWNNHVGRVETSPANSRLPSPW